MDSRSIFKRNQPRRYRVKSEELTVAMKRDEIRALLSESRKAFTKGDFKVAEYNLQKCIEVDPQVSKDYMKKILEDETNQDVKDHVLKLYFLNFI